LDWNWVPGNPTNLPATNFAEARAPRQDLKPGVYRTSPYTLLVLVPGPQHDGGWFLKAAKTAPEKMPAFRPELKFIPFTAEK